jgi:hypothetical protein
MSQKSSDPQAVSFASQALKRDTPPLRERRLEAAIKAEINEAKNTLDLMRMATAIARLDALHAETEAASKPEEAGD